MLKVQMERTPRYCDGLTRRSFVRIGMAGMGAMSLPSLLEAKSQSSQAKDTSVILLWLDGGPGHMDMYDMKPEAPVEYRGIWKPIPTNVPGFEVTELFPLQAKIADKFSIVRSLHHDSGDHFTGAHHMLTGRGGVSGADTAGKSPGIGAIATRLCGPRKAGMPPYVAVPYAMSVGLRPGYFAADYVGLEHNPFETVADPNSDKFRVENLSLAQNLSLDRLADRRSLRQKFDKLRRDVDSSGMLESMDRFDRTAYDLVTGPAARQAFDISSEDPRLRDRYGRHSWGQSTLLCRRLVEAGSTFVTAHFGGWDHHWDLEAGYNRYLPMVDQAVASLFTDLSERGLWDKVLVVLCGEFSRTPRMNDGGNGGAPRSMGTPGRDHWGNSMFCLMGGGGVKGGQIYGSTTRLGDAPQDRPVTPTDIHATIYHALGVNPYTNFVNHSGRPVPAIDNGAPIRELLS